MIRFYDSCRFFLLTTLVASLMGCMGSSSTVSKNPVAVPTELYAAPTEAQATPIAAQMDDLQSIDHDLNNGNYDAAQQQLALLTSSNDTNPALQTNLIILQTKLALLTGNPKQAMTWLNQLEPALLTNPAQLHYLTQLRSQALYRTNQILLSALADINDNSESAIIWTKLLMVDPADLHAQQTNTTIAGWLALAQIAQHNANNYPALKRTITSWQQTYPQHPANNLLAELNNPSQNPTEKIAVILPLSGNYATLGQSVQQGMLAAYYASPAKTHQRITFYDSNAESISTIYEKIQASGDQLILGPLTKEDTESLLNIAKDSPHIISLNYTSMNTPNSHLEFGLSPEDEARQTAEFAWRQGKSSAIIIAPKTAKGEQTAHAFMQAWTSLGGQVVDRYDYATHDDFSKSIATLLGVTDSQWRQRTLHTALQIRITSTPYFRKDADMVFLSADAQSARQIRPFIKFYAGNYLSVFATSSVYGGTNNLNNDKDLNDVYFCDMPAILTNTSIQHDRLYFLGADSYLLAMQQTHLNTLPHFPLMGATGHLTVDATHDIQRELVCAQFKDGRPTPLNTPS
ncbi:MAG: penicillin-binding protein activator [Pseudomonadota bacterium]